MREIKFRAWNGRAMDDYPFDAFNDYALEDGRLCHVCGPDSEPYTQPSKSILMQYTGLTDKNGKEIYEGDVLVLRAVWGGFQSEVIFKDGFFGMKDRSFIYPLYDSWRDSLKVVGNIYENPELLEGDQ